MICRKSSFIFWILFLLVSAAHADNYGGVRLHNCWDPNSAFVPAEVNFHRKFIKEYVKQCESHNNLNENCQQRVEAYFQTLLSLAKGTSEFFVDHNIATATFFSYHDGSSSNLLTKVSGLNPRLDGIYPTGTIGGGLNTRPYCKKADKNLEFDYLIGASCTLNKSHPVLAGTLPEGQIARGIQLFKSYTLSFESGIIQKNDGTEIAVIEITDYTQPGTHGARFYCWVEHL